MSAQQERRGKPACMALQAVQVPRGLYEETIDVTQPAIKPLEISERREGVLTRRLDECRKRIQSPSFGRCQRGVEVVSRHQMVLLARQGLPLQLAKQMAAHEAKCGRQL